MGITIVLQDKNSNHIEVAHDEKNLLRKLLPSFDDTSYQCLRFIDLYGDTIFNRLQMKTVLSELERISSCATSVEEEDLLGRIENLAKQCKNKPHLYLKFYGD